MSGIKHQCSGTTYPKGTSKFGMTQSRPCTRSGSVERNGRWYCKTHDPKAVHHRAQAREAVSLMDDEMRVRINAILETRAEVVEIARRIHRTGFSEQAAAKLAQVVTRLDDLEAQARQHPYFSQEK